MIVNAKEVLSTRTYQQSGLRRPLGLREIKSERSSFRFQVVVVKPRVWKKAKSFE
jgi:hypothetical protein|tara:strand:+ start:137 stop:301 length:165 start_codon:yes stop_codon:yes gene_type:complete